MQATLVVTNVDTVDADHVELVLTSVPADWQRADDKDDLQFMDGTLRVRVPAANAVDRGQTVTFTVK